MISGTEDLFFQTLEAAFGADCWEAESFSGESLQLQDNHSAPPVSSQPQTHRSRKPPSCEACNR
jgi:hypothetical protein